jgi:hypothetical protein
LRRRDPPRHRPGKVAPVESFELGWVRSPEREGYGVRSVSRYALIAALAAGSIFAATLAFAHGVASTNTLDSVTPQGDSGKVIVIGTFTPGSEPAFGVDCGPAEGRPVFAVDETTSTTFATHKPTGAGGAYDSKTKSPDQGKFTPGLHTVHTVIEGMVGGPYAAVHPCMDAVSNSRPVTIPS